MKAELDDMEKRGVIRKVEEPTDWINSMAIVEKPETPEQGHKKRTFSATHH